MTSFPVCARVRSTASDIPAPEAPGLETGIFDAYGYWATFGVGPLTLPGDALDTGNQIAKMLNAAYEQGKADARRELREALGINE